MYHGSPVRIYGRYKGSGEGKVTINANVLGIEFKQAVTMDFPETDTTNPEIERMWAWKRVDQLLKQADRTGSRDNVLNEIVQLGETYSIVTEYTSFLVLENDAEYKRWKIDRRNVARLSRDRDAQALRKEKLDTIRNKAVANIGPATEEKAKPQAQAPQARPTQMARNTSTPTPSRPSRSRNLDFNFGTGTGPVGPLFIGLIMLLARKRKKNS